MGEGRVGKIVRLDGEDTEVRKLNLLLCFLCLGCGSNIQSYQLGGKSVELRAPSGWDDYHTKDSSTTHLSWDQGKDSATDLEGHISVSHQPSQPSLDTDKLKPPNATDLKEGKLDVGGGTANAAYLEYVTEGGGGPLGKGKLHHVMVFYEQGDELYTMSLASRDKNFTSHRATFDRLLKSFKVVRP